MERNGRHENHADGHSYRALLSDPEDTYRLQHPRVARFVMMMMMQIGRLDTKMIEANRVDDNKGPPLPVSQYPRV